MIDAIATAKEYGKALFLLTEESGTTEKVREDIGTMLGALENNEDYYKLLNTPALSKEERLGIIDAAFATLDPCLVNLMKILTEKRLAHLMGGAIKGFEDAYDEARGIERVDAITAIPMTDAQLCALKAKLEDITHKQIIIKNTVDPEILGGIKLRYMGIQMDGSVKTRLDSFERRLRDTIV